MSGNDLMLPDIRAGDLSSRQERRRILEYLYQLSEQLRYTLSHIGTKNLDAELKADLGALTETGKRLTRKFEDADGRASLLRQTVGELSASVRTQGAALDGIAGRLSEAEIRITDSAIVSTVMRSEDYQEARERIYADMDARLGYRLEIRAETVFLTENVRTTTLTARVWHGNDDVTDAIPAERFRWYRESDDAMADGIWNEAHQGMKSVLVSTADVLRLASFRCELMDA